MGRVIEREGDCAMMMRGPETVNPDLIGAGMLDVATNRLQRSQRLR
jgi:hypothetical protein